jgi:membrane-associated phospholipid phosphatase
MKWRAHGAWMGIGLLLSASGAMPPLVARAEDKPASRSVYQVDPVTDGFVIGGTLLGSILPEVFADHLINVRTSVNPDEVNPLDRHVIGNRNVAMDNLSDATVVIFAFAPAVGDYFDVGASPELLEDLTVYAETLSVNSALTTLFKYAVQRPLPRVYAGTDPELASSAGGYRAFYSGHVSSAFSALSAASVTLGLRHHTTWWPWAVTVVLGTSIAAERVAAGRHFYTDVGVGAIMGTAVGVLVPWLHKREPESMRRFGLMSIGDGAALTWEKRF